MIQWSLWLSFKITTQNIRIKADIFALENANTGMEVENDIDGFCCWYFQDLGKDLFYLSSG